MTDTGRIPEGGEPEQGFPFPVQADDVVEGEEEDLLMPGAHVAWGDAAPTPQPITPAAPRPAQLAPLFPALRPGGAASAWPQPATPVPAAGAAQVPVNAAHPDTPPASATPVGGGVATAVVPGVPTPGVAPAPPAVGPVPAPGAATDAGPVAPVAGPAEAGATAPATDDSGAAPGAPVPDVAPAAVPGQDMPVPGPAADAAPAVGDGAVSAGPEAAASASGGAAVPGAPQTATPDGGVPGAGAVAPSVPGSGQAPPPADAAPAVPGDSPTDAGEPGMVPAPGAPEAGSAGQDQAPAEEPAATGEPGDVVATAPETTDGTVTASEGSPAAPPEAAAAPGGQAPVPAGAPAVPAPVPSPDGAVAAAPGSPVAAEAAPGGPVPGESEGAPAPAAVPAEPVGPPADGDTTTATPATVTAAAPDAPRAPAAAGPGPTPPAESNAPASAAPGTHDGPVTEGAAPETAAPTAPGPPDGTEAPAPAADPAGSDTDAVAHPPAAAGAPAQAVVAPQDASPAEPEAPAPGASAEPPAATAPQDTAPASATATDSPAEPAAAAVTPPPAGDAEAGPDAVTVTAPATTAAEAAGAHPAPAAPDGTPAPGPVTAPAPAADAAGAPLAADAVAPEAGPAVPDGTSQAPVPAAPPAAPAPEAVPPAAPANGPAAPPAAPAAPGAASITQHVAAPSGRPATSAAPPAADPAALHRLMREPRDVRHGFLPDPIPHEVLLRVLESAHTAPTSGHAQPWDFVIIRSAETRTQVHELAVRQHEAYAKSLPKGRAKQFKELKTDAIVQTPVNIVVTADPTRGGRHTPLPHQQPQLAPYSSALAVENLWLAARAEGLGVGWVSFYDDRELVRTLELPEHLEIVAYLCIGYVDAFADETGTATPGPARQRPLSWVVHDESYGRRALPGAEPHDLLSETLEDIRPLDAQALAEAWERQKRMTKPSGALGALEVISAQLCGLSRHCPPPLPEPAAVAIFAGDHGVHAQGVTPWPQEVTGQMVANFLGGGAVCNAFAQQVGAEVCVIDVGVRGELPGQPGLMPRKVRPGTADITAGPAMSREEAQRAIEVGIETARDLVAAGNRALLTGEMGIANTTVAAALIAVFTGSEPSEVTGRGTGVDDETHARKIDVVRRALHLHQPDAADPIGVLAAVGGLEHAALTGFILGGASLRVPVILDGVSAGAAALTARAIAPEAVSVCVAGHRSAEPGHMAALTALGLRPLVDLDLRLGEGTGALLALPVVQSAARAMREVATFDAAGVSDKN
ncbi:nicotinate-nucleotide--dimethylbenzimidazole phosphoribosyltransferase [Streptomyces xiamenensis]|uniref:nicotinate-nucleotide--dimethylbenzimidazole phosphoribosyltransferase n=1 Tax=Streptomyces xiamenensis TaxID=408015 RepID=UPI0034171185